MQQCPVVPSSVQQGCPSQESFSETIVPQQNTGHSAADYLREVFLRECDTRIHDTPGVSRAATAGLDAPSISVPAPLSGVTASQERQSVPSLLLKDSIRAVPLAVSSSKMISTSSNPPMKATRPRVPITKTTKFEGVTYLTLSQAPTQESPEFTDPDSVAGMRPQIRETQESPSDSLEHDLADSLLFDMANAVSSSVAVRALS